MRADEQRLKDVPDEPMSWKWGSHPTTVAAGSVPNERLIMASLARMLACETITPFGLPVEPDVYCRKASEAASMLGSSHPAALPRETSSAARHGTPAAAARPASRMPRADTTAEGVASACRPESRAMSRERAGTGAGTATTPA